MEHRDALRYGRIAHRPTVNRAGDAECENIEDKPSYNLARSYGDVHPSQKNIRNDTNEHCDEQTDPDHSCVVGRKEARQSAEKNSLLDPHIQHTALLGERFTKSSQQHWPRKLQAGG